MELMFREYYASDLPAIEAINSDKYPIDGLGGGLDRDFILKGVCVCNDNKVVGFGGIKRIYEAIMILDQKLDKKDKINVMHELFLYGKLRSEAAKISTWHHFVKDPDWAEILQKHYSCIKYEGATLYQRL